MKNVRVFFLILCLSLFPALLRAQERIDTLSFSMDNKSQTSLLTSVDKQLNTYNLNISLGTIQHYKDFFFKLSEDYKSTLINSTPKNVKDEHFLSLVTGYKISNEFSSGFLLNGSILADDRKLALNEASNTSAAAFLKFQPTLKEDYIVPYFGYMDSRLIGQNDIGALYGFEGKLEKLSLAQDFQLSSVAKYNNEDISPRKNYQRMFRITGENIFGGDSRNILSGYFSRHRKDYYFDADSITALKFSILNNIQSRTESNYYVQEQYNLQTGYLSQDLSARTVWKTIERSTRYKYLTNNSSPSFDVNSEEFRLEFESATRYSIKDLNLALRFSYSEKNEQYIVEKFSSGNQISENELTRLYEERAASEKQKNNKSVRTLISVSGDIRLSAKDRLSFSILHNKLKYDTPSSDNYDDRDELLSIFRILYNRKLSPLFEMEVNLEASFNHIVYIFSQRSANNNYRRIAKLATSGNYKGKNLTSVNNLSVSANYTVYDFEDLNPNYRSFSFRQMSMADSSEYRFTKRLSISTYGYLKLSEQGEFHWNSFSGRPTRDLNELFDETCINFRLSNMRLAFGYRYLRLKTYTYLLSEISTESRYISKGPVVLVDYLMAERLNIKMTGAYEHIQYEQNKYRNLASLSLQVLWQF